MTILLSNEELLQLVATSYGQNLVCPTCNRPGVLKAEKHRKEFQIVLSRGNSKCTLGFLKEYPAEVQSPNDLALFAELKFNQPLVLRVPQRKRGLYLEEISKAV